MDPLSLCLGPKESVCLAIWSHHLFTSFFIGGATLCLSHSPRLVDSRRLSDIEAGRLRSTLTHVDKTYETSELPRLTITLFR